MSIRIALAGNPNCGKTTIFNNLTGSSQYVGNWPGVTVEKKEGRLRGHREVICTDLPGVYSLSPYTPEEVVTREYLLRERPDAVINVVDATNIERNLYLTTQILELGIPVVVALNMMDLAEKDGELIYEEKLSAVLGCPVIKTSALKGFGLSEAVEAAVNLAAGRNKTEDHRRRFSPRVEAAIEEISRFLPEGVEEERRHWYGLKLLEGDKRVEEEVCLPKDFQKQVEEIRGGLERVLDDDAESIVTNERYDYITGILKNCVKKGRAGMTVSDRIDRVVTNRFLALPIFAVIMFVVYYVSVTSVGTLVTDFTNDTLFGAWIQPGLEGLLSAAGAADWLISLAVDGIVGGLAAPIGFAPQMAILFLFLSVLEDCGYMARAAFIMDRIFSGFGLSGKSFIPMLISTGCGVPGIMAAKTIEDDKNRRMTIMTATFIPCGAKLPVIALISGAIMGGAWWMAPSMYFIGIAAVVVSCVILKKTRGFAGETSPFLIELPRYHLPSAGTVLIHVWERVWSFLKKAGTILFLCCMAMWFLASFGVENGRFGMVGNEGASLLAGIGGILAPLFTPLGFGSWQAVASTLSGFVAKEGIVGTMGVLSNMAKAGEGDSLLWSYIMVNFFKGSSVAAFSFLLFNLLNSPCLAAISAMAKELGSRKQTVFALVYQNVFAYAVSLIVFQLGSYVAGGVFTAWTAVGIGAFALFLFLLLRPEAGAKRAAGARVMRA